MDMVFSRRTDPSIAPPGDKQILSCFGLSAYKLAAGTWDDSASGRRHGDDTIAVRQNPRESSLHRQVQTPPISSAIRADRRANTIFQGELTLEQLFSSARPGWESTDTIRKL